MVDLVMATMVLCGVCLEGLKGSLGRPRRGGQAQPPSRSEVEAYVPRVQAFARAWRAVERDDRDAALAAGVRQFMVDAADSDARSAALEGKLEAMLLDYVREMARRLDQVSGQASRGADA